jgi:hypothetical protein
MPEQKPFIALTFGGAWTQLFEESLARKLSGIEHVPLGNPQYVFPENLFAYHCQTNPMKPEAAKELYERLNGKGIQSSELAFKFIWFVKFSSIVFVDSKLLDRAVGQFILSESKILGRPAYGVATDTNSSPLAAAFLKATFYPETPDDLVKVCLQQQVESKRP